MRDFSEKVPNFETSSPTAGSIDRYWSRLEISAPTRDNISVGCARVSVLVPVMTTREARGRAIRHRVLRRARPDGRSCRPERTASGYPSRVIPDRPATSPERDDNLGASSVDFSSPDLDHATNRNRLVAPKIEDSFQNQVGVQAGRSKSRRVASLQGQRNQNPGVERAVVIGIAGKTR